jgi:hypothetical protein
MAKECRECALRATIKPKACRCQANRSIRISGQLNDCTNGILNNGTKEIIRVKKHKMVLSLYLFWDVQKQKG